MSLDRIHDIAGLMQLAAQPVIGTTGTASTVASNQFPGGYQFGSYNGIIAGTNSTNGGAYVNVPSPRGQATTDFQSFAATSGTITHDNAAVILLSVSTTGSNYAIQQAAYHGQTLTIVPVGTTGSILSLLTTTGVGGTTTAACAVAQATTFASTGPCVLQAFAQFGGTATTNVPFVWRRII
jgi:hypothetical protein